MTRNILSGKCDRLRAALFPANGSIPPEFPPTYTLMHTRDLVDTFEPVTPIELYQALATTTTGSAPGTDGIRWSMIAALHSAIPNHLCDLYGSLLRHRIHSNRWKTAICILIPKSEKKDTNAAKSYGPISILSCLGKALEKIVARRMSHLAATLKVIANPQMGSQAHRSPTDALLRILTPAQDWLVQTKPNKTSRGTIL